MNDEQLRPQDSTPTLSHGIFATAIDRDGRSWPVEYNILTNAGSGNGVLIDGSSPGSHRLPTLLALGGAVGERAAGGVAVGYWQFSFHSYTRCQPTLRGALCGRPDVELLCSNCGSPS
ncbi:hypothetical protein [Deinococcus ruber]|uniref:Uncharacterized protein n=1 Tax=Deinococcus ruber TaxID=1848197 RepID=A0A918FEU6_9DEIO|nr:hypothetical protein [Deinococcus ruber]GGR31845.1 hypothetical protein GCM10008957_48100 [Deinococcus ruber]